jgi:hypothetical protein
MLESYPTSRFFLSGWILRSSRILFDLLHFAEVSLAVQRIYLVVNIFASLGMATALKVRTVTKLKISVRKILVDEMNLAARWLDLATDISEPPRAL